MKLSWGSRLDQAGCHAAAAYRFSLYCLARLSLSAKDASCPLFEIFNSCCVESIEVRLRPERLYFVFTLVTIKLMVSFFVQYFVVFDRKIQFFGRLGHWVDFQLCVNLFGYLVQRLSLRPDSWRSILFLMFILY